jgi:ferredoxin
MARILSIYIDPNTCTCSQACVFECPEVLDGDTKDGVPLVRAGAERYFETHVEQIKRVTRIDIASLRQAYES